MIKINNLVKIYNKGKPSEIQALERVSFEINKGDYIAIMGVSGSGKTTLLNIIGCLDNYDEGEYYLDDKNIKSLSPKEIACLRNKKFGYVLQEYGLIMDRSVYDNVSIPLVFNDDVSLKEFKIKIVSALKEVGMERYIKTKVRDLSGGERQKVAIARAIINEPDVLLADEPSASLDSNNRDMIMDLFEQLNSNGISVVIVSHDYEISKRAKICYHLKDGKISK